MDNSTQYQSEHGHTTWWEFEYAISVTQVLIATAVWREAYPEEQDTRTNFEGVVNDVIDLVGSKYGYKLPKVELSSDARSVRVIGANVDNIPQDQAAKIVSLWIETLLTMVAKDVTDMLSGLSNNAVDQCVTTGEGEGITGSVKQLQSLYNTLMVQTRIYAPVYLDFDKDRKAGKTNFNITALRLLHIACGMVFGRLPDKSLDCGAVPLYSNAGDPAYIQDSNLVFSDAFVSFFTSGALPDFNDIYEYIPPNCRPVQHGAAREHHSGGPSAASNTPNITRANGKNDDDDMIDFCAGEQGNEAKPYEKPRTALPQYSSYDGGREGGRDVLAKGREETGTPIRSTQNSRPSLIRTMMINRELRASLRPPNQSERSSLVALLRKSVSDRPCSINGQRSDCYAGFRISQMRSITTQSQTYISLNRTLKRLEHHHRLQSQKCKAQEIPTNLQSTTTRSPTP